MGQSSARTEMEKWFSRAIKINPGDYTACDRKLYYLEPKWHGSVEEMFQFAREIGRASDDPRALQIPLILPQAHWRLAESNVVGTPPRSDYFKANPQAWTEITSVYEAYLQRVPRSTYHRTRYAVLAAAAGHPEVAQAQFEILDENYSRAVLVNWSMMGLRQKLSRSSNSNSTSKPAGKSVSGPRV
jgi:hypothetical protein